MPKFIIEYPLIQAMSCDDDICKIVWTDAAKPGEATLVNGSISCKKPMMTREENLTFLDMVLLGETKNVEPGRILTIEEA